MIFKLFLLFAVIPVIELYLLIKIGGEIGAFNTILIIIVTAVAGSYLAKSQGFIVISKIKIAVAEGRIPGKELLHGLFVLIGAFALLTPGFITDLVGITMLLPGTRELYIRFAEKFFRNKFNIIGR